ASSLQPGERQALGKLAVQTLQNTGAQRLQLGDEQYLSVSRQLPSSPHTVSVLVQRRMHAVMSPYRDVRDAMLVIGTLALLASIGIGLVAGRSASQPIAALVRAARRIEEGRYDSPVPVRGAKDFRQLASTFNAMQSGIADRETRITHLA